jgi:hypothetical protein
MNNIEQFTLQLAKQLAIDGWDVKDNGERGVPESIEKIQDLLRHVQACLPLLKLEDLETRIERARRELAFLEGLR